MRRIGLFVSSLAAVAWLSSPAWAVVTTFTGTSIQTGQPVMTTITFEDGKTVKDNQTVDLPTGSIMRFTDTSESTWTGEGRCTIGTGPTQCPFEVNTVYPFQDDAPPFGVILFHPFNTYQNLNNLPLRRFQVQDRGPGFATSNVSSRQDIGQRNNFQNYPLNFNIAGGEVVVGLPQGNFGPFQLNGGIGGQFGALTLTKQQTDRSNNANGNQSFNGDGFASGIRLETVLSAPGMPLFGSGIPGFRGTYTGTWGTANGSGMSRTDQGDLGSFGFVPNSAAETSVRLAYNRLTGEFQVTTLQNHLTLGIGGGWQQVSANTQILASGNIPGPVPVQRMFRYVSRGDEIFGIASADFFMGNFFPVLGPLAGRIETQIGPDSFGIFAKLTWMFGAAGGQTLPQRLWNAFPPNNPAR